MIDIYFGIAVFHLLYSTVVHDKYTTYCIFEKLTLIIKPIKTTLKHFGGEKYKLTNLL